MSSFNRNVHVNVTATTTGLVSGMKQAVSATAQATTQMKSFGSVFSSSSMGPLNNFQTSLQTLPKHMDEVGKSTQGTGSKLKSFGEAIKGNRGLVFGFAGLTSAMAETVGMFGMLGDAQQMVQEDQDKLNKLTQAGMEGTNEYKVAQQDLLKHTRFLNMANRNTALSLMDNVFFLTMAANGIIELTSKGTKLTGVFTKMKNAITSLGSASRAYSTLIVGSSGLVAGTTALEAIMGKTGRTIDTATASTWSLRAAALAALGPILALVAALGLAVGGIATVQDMSNAAMKNDPDAFKKDSTGNVDKSWFGPNSLLGRTLNGEPVPGEKTPLKNGGEDFKNSFMGKILKDLPGYKQLGDTISGLANQTFPELAKANGTASGETLKAATNQELFNGALRQSQADVSASTKLVADFNAGVLSSGLNNEQAAGAIDLYIEGLKGEQESLLRTDATAGALAITKDKLVEKYGQATKASGDYSLFVANEKAVLEDKLRVDTEYADMEAEIAKQHSANAVAIAEAEQEARDYAEAVGENVIMGKLDYDMAMKVRDVHLSVRDAYKEEELGLMKLAEENGIMINNLNEKTQNTVDDTNAMRDQIAAQLDWTASLENTARTTEMQSKANLQAKLDLQELADSIIYTNTHSEVYRQGLEKLVQTKLGLSNTSNMLTKELEYFAVNGLMNTTDKLIALQRQFEEMRDNSLNFFSDLINSDDMKDFNEAWKELDLGAVPKDMRDELKDAFKDFKKYTEDGKEVATSLNLVNAAMGDLSEKQVDKILKKTFNEMEKLAKIDPELRVGMAQYPSMFADIENNAKRLPLSFGKLTEVLSDGNLTWDELQQLLFVYQQEASGADEKTIDLSGSTSKFNDELAKVAVTAVVVETIADMWGNLGEMIINANLILQKSWSETVLNMAKMTSDLVKETAKTWAALIKGMHKMNVAAANSWERAMKNIVHNTEAASSQTQSKFSAMVKKLNSHFVKVANNWQRAAMNMVSNAKTAADKIQSAINSIKGKTVYIDVVRRGDGGSITGKAEGGIISAAHGFTTSGPQLLLVGDNPGGRETIAAIPHDSPKRTMDELNRKFGNGEEGGSQVINFSPTIVIGQDKLTFTQRYRIQQGESVANQV